MNEEEETHPTISVLDHGFVRLINYMGSDLAIARNARVSYDAAWRAGEDTEGDAKLIRYLYKNGHNTPFEAVLFTFEVKAPIFVLRQWMRHRTQSYNEVSARYKELPEEFYTPLCSQITTPSPSNKQGRTTKEHPEALRVRKAMKSSCESSFAMYRELLAIGTPRELARGVLPVGTYSHMFCTVNLNNLFKFLKERLHHHAQYEIRVYAEALLAIIVELVPVAAHVFLEEAFPETLKQGDKK